MTVLPRSEHLEPRRLFAAENAPGVLFDAPVAATTLAPSSLAGHAERGFATVDVNNAGASVLVGAVTAQISAVQTGQLLASATPVGMVTRPERIRPGQTVAIRVTVQLTSQLAVGTYHLVAAVSGPVDLAAAGEESSKASLSVVKPGPLFAERVIAPADLNAVLDAGGRAAVHVLLHNGGTAIGTLETVGLYGSTDASFAQATLITQNLLARSLRPGQSHEFTFVLAMRPATRGGDLEDLFARVTDAAGLATLSVATPV